MQEELQSLQHVCLCSQSIVVQEHKEVVCGYVRYSKAGQAMYAPPESSDLTDDNRKVHMDARVLQLHYTLKREKESETGKALA